VLVVNVKKEWFALGLVLIVAGFALLSFSNTVVYTDNYLAQGSLDNTVYEHSGLTPRVSVSGHFDAGQRLWFNFTKGNFWGVQYDIQNEGLEPANTEFAPGTAIEPYKTIYFNLYTPSGDVVSTEVYLVGGTEPFAVVYFNQSADFVPLPGGNLTFASVGVEGTIERTGNYTIVATTIQPLVRKDAQNTYDVVANSITGKGAVQADPPLTMNLWSIDAVETKPYLVSFVTVGAVILVPGVISSVWATRPKRRRARDRLNKTRQ
jgi:hypothetical protein